MEEATRVKGAWTKFKELSPILTAHGASLYSKGKNIHYTALCPKCGDIWD